MYLSLLKVNTGDNPDRPRPGRTWLADLYRVHQRLWMAFPDEKRVVEDPFFVGTWDSKPADAPKPGRAQRGFLFRIERDGEARILVQSAERPNWGYAFQNAPYLLRGEPKMREFEPAPNVGGKYRFRALLNVVKTERVPHLSHPSGGMRRTKAGHELVRRKRVDRVLLAPELPRDLPPDLVARAELMDRLWKPWREWFEELAESNGFGIETGDGKCLRMESVYVLVRKPTKGATNERRRPAGRYNAGLFEGVLTCTDAEKMKQAMVAGLGHGKAFGFGLLSVAPV